MASVKTLVVAGSAVILSLNAAGAADLVVPPPLPVAVEFSGWYLRGDIGMSNQAFKGLSHPAFPTVSQLQFFDKGGFDSAPFFGLGVGYQLNNWFRVDLTGEYRGKANFHALDSYYDTWNLGYRNNEYTASKSEWVGLFNAYVDLGTWWCVTPFIGAGVGFAHNRIDHLRDNNIIAGGGGWASSGTKDNLAWAFYAGLAYKVTPGLTIELAYRYLNVGDAESGVLRNLDPTFVSNNPKGPMTFNDIYSNDFKLGVRWNLSPEPVVVPPPALIRKG